MKPCFAGPYTGHDKGGVEGRGKGIRWQHLVPIPRGPELDSVSRTLLQRLDERFDPHAFDRELARMIVKPAKPYRAAKVQPGAVSRCALVEAEGALYSV